ncbi:MAG TPA: hypothetical protein PKC29_06380 [Thermodesulfobacteriota bacterium]|nr:hypothetical protein [Thermodesulfobacteriota bacterium]
METIGKILSITLLTIFGSAAGAIYLVDNGVLSSIFETAPAAYTSDSKTDMPDETFYQAPSEPGSERREYASLRHTRPQETVAEGTHKGAIWGQTYGTVDSGAGNDGAYRLAGGSTADSLRRNSEYWKNEYVTAKNEGRTSDAKKAYKKYLEYEEALRIKLDSGS